MKHRGTCVQTISPASFSMPACGAIRRRFSSSPGLGIAQLPCIQCENVDYLLGNALAAQVFNRAGNFKYIK
jgi:hypothetical protein